MKKEFTPRIDRKTFKAIIASIQDNEGNNPNVVTTIAQKIKDTQEIYFFDIFMKICHQYHVDYKYYEDMKASSNRFKVVVIVNGRNSWNISYDDVNYDISEKLASKLYSMVSVQIRNEEFMNSVSK